MPMNRLCAAIIAQPFGNRALRSRKFWYPINRAERPRTVIFLALDCSKLRCGSGVGKLFDHYELPPGPLVNLNRDCHLVGSLLLVDKPECEPDCLRCARLKSVCSRHCAIIQFRQRFLVQLQRVFQGYQVIGFHTLYSG